MQCIRIAMYVLVCVVVYNSLFALCVLLGREVLVSRDTSPHNTGRKMRHHQNLVLWSYYTIISQCRSTVILCIKTQIHAVPITTSGCELVLPPAGEPFNSSLWLTSWYARCVCERKKTSVRNARNPGSRHRCVWWVCFFMWDRKSVV